MNNLVATKYCFFFFAHTFTFQLLDKPVVTGVVPSPPRFLPSIFIAHRVQQSHCSSIFHRVSLKGSVIIKEFVFRALCCVVARIALATDCCSCCWSIRSAPRRERGWMLSETSEKRAKIMYFERYSLVILGILMYGAVD